MQVSAFYTELDISCNDLKCKILSNSRINRYRTIYVFCLIAIIKPLSLSLSLSLSSHVTSTKHIIFFLIAYTHQTSCPPPGPCRGGSCVPPRSPLPGGREHFWRSPALWRNYSQPSFLFWKLKYSNQLIQRFAICTKNTPPSNKTGKQIIVRI